MESAKRALSTGIKDVKEGMESVKDVGMDVARAAANSLPSRRKADEEEADEDVPPVEPFNERRDVGVASDHWANRPHTTHPGTIERVREGAAHAVEGIVRKVEAALPFHHTGEPMHTEGRKQAEEDTMDKAIKLALKDEEASHHHVHQRASAEVSDFPETLHDAISAANQKPGPEAQAHLAALELADAEEDAGGGAGGGPPERPRSRL